MEKVDISKIKLEYKGGVGAGKQVLATIGQKVPCVEFTMRDDVAQPIIYKPDPPQFILFAERWIQFAPKAWNEMLDEIFTEMVSLWNEKYGHTEIASSKS